MVRSKLIPPAEREAFGYRVIAETREAFCVPTLGPIIEGHCLVFSRRSVLNLTLLDAVERKGYAEMVRAMAELVETAYGPSVVFEHGAVERGDRIGCGVDRAHLHVLPGVELSRVLAVLDTKHRRIGEWATFSEWLTSAPPADRPYILIGSTGDEVLMYEYCGPRESQCVRRIVASLVGRPDSWDWREAKDDHIMERTLETLRGAAVE